MIQTYGPPTGTLRHFLMFRGDRLLGYSRHGEVRSIRFWGGWIDDVVRRAQSAAHPFLPHGDDRVGGTALQGEGAN